MGDAKNFHIRCSQGCDCPADPLLFLECKLCVYHHKCLPEKCRCEKLTATMQLEEFSKCLCFVEGCRKSKAGPNCVFCPNHCKEIVSAIVHRLKILGVMQQRDLGAFLKEHRDLRQCQGDLIQLAELEVMDALSDTWQVYIHPDQRKIQYITIRAAELVSGPISKLKEFLALHNLPTQASALIHEDATSQKNGWRYLEGGNIGIVSKSRQFESKERLLTFLRAQSNLTYEVGKAIAMYDAAAEHVCALIEEDKLTFVENGTLLYLKPPPKFDPWAAAYWRTHVLDGLLSKISQKPGHGAVPSHAVH